MGPGTLRTVMVAGGGLTGWCAAAALKRRAPFLDVTVVAGEPAPGALADRIACTLPSLLGFHGDLGIGEEDGVLRTGAGYRLGSLFSGWANSLPDYVHAYGRYGRPFGPTSFHLHWVRAARQGDAAAFDTYSAAAALARAGLFAPPSAQPGTALGDLQYGLTIDPVRQTGMMRAFALHCGVREVAGEVTGAALDARGFVASARLTDGRSLPADLFVDATGPAARLRTSLDDRRDDWSRWLPCDRVILAHAPATAPPPVLTPVTATAAGWRWSSGAQAGLAYASAHLSDAKAARQLRNVAGMEPGGTLGVRAGTRPAPWRANCIAIGDAATEVEPLEWCNLHLALSAIDRLVTMLPGHDVAAVEAADFNRQSLAEAERVRDFLAAHYRTACRDDPMWRAAAAAEPPDSLAHTLALFAERGRLPFYEEETFTRDSWAAVLLGQGFLPRRIDPLVNAVPAHQAKAAMTNHAAAIAAALPGAPAHAAYLAAQMRRIAR